MATPSDDDTTGPRVPERVKLGGPLDPVAITVDPRRALILGNPENSRIVDVSVSAALAHAQGSRKHAGVVPVNQRRMPEAAHQ